MPNIAVEQTSARLQERLAQSIEIAAGVLGLSAYVYLLGGMAYWLRLHAAGLPANIGIVAADADRLLVGGVRVLLVEAAAFVVLYVAALVARRTLTPLAQRLRRPSSREANESALASPTQPSVDDVSLTLLVGIVAFIAWLMVQQVWSDVAAAVASVAIFVGGFVALLLVTHGPSESASLTTSRTMGVLRNRRCPPLLRFGLGLVVVVVFVVGLVVVSALPGVLILSAVAVVMFSQRHVAPPPGPSPPLLPSLSSSSSRSRAQPGLSSLGSRVGAAFSPAVLLGLGLLAVIGATYLATPPIGLDRVTWRKTGEVTDRTAGYVGRAGDQLYLATCRGDPISDARILAVPDDDIDDLRFGGDRYRFDVGIRPSLVAILVGALGEGSEPRDAPIAIRLRPSRPSCPQ